MTVSFDLTNLNSVVQSKLDALNSSTTPNDLVLVLKGLEAAFASILNGSAINTSNAITSIGDTKIAAINTAGSTQLNSVNTAGSTQVSAVNSAGATALGQISTADTNALADVEAARLAAVRSVTNAAGGTNPFLLIGA